jgi:Spy/CpxP family protein refolding chaperone
MKKGFKAVAAVMAVASLGALAACRHGHQGHDPKKLKEHIESTLKKIGTTEEQQAKIGPVTDRIIADCGEVHKSGQGLRQKFVADLLRDNPDRAGLHGMVDEKAKEFTAFAHRTIDSLIEISATLTSGQRAELKKRFEAAHGAGKQ